MEEIWKMKPTPAEDHPAFALAHADEISSLRQVPDTGYPPYDAYVAPSRFWGEKLGLPGIHRDYGEVLGDRHPDIQVALFDIHRRSVSDEAREAEVLRLFRDLAEACPDLPTDLALTAKDAASIVHGCVSQFSPEDIRFYLADNHIRQKQAWRDRKKEVERLVGGWHFEWCPSFATLDLIETRLTELGDEFDLLCTAEARSHLDP
jgi:hypothetical protein